MLRSYPALTSAAIIFATATAISTSATADLVYATGSSTDSLHIVNLDDGSEVTLIGPLHPDPTRYTTPISMAIRPSDGEVFIINNTPVGDAGVSSVDTETGLASLVAASNAGTITFDGNNRLLTISGDQLAVVDQNTGTFISTFGAGLASVRGLDFNPHDGMLYGVSGFASSSVIHRIDPNTGTEVSAVSLTSALTGSVAGSLIVDSEGVIHVATNGAFDNLVEVDPDTGVVSNVRTSAVSMQGMALAPPCPEDLNGDGFVNVGDLLQLLGSWGTCP